MTEPNEPVEGNGGFSFQDKRRIDPETGEVREQPAAPGPEPADEFDRIVEGIEVEGGFEAVDARVTELTADLQRVHAEYANYRKRVERDRETVKDLAVGAALGDLLPVLDDIGRARDHGDLEGAFKSVAESFESTVARIGLDAALRWSRDRVGSATLAYSAVRAKFDGGPYDDNRVPLVPTHTLSVNGDYYLLHSLALMGGVRYVTRQYLGSDFNNSAPPLKGYTLVDCGLRYEPSFIEGLRVTLSVDNVFGRDYCDYAGWSSFSGDYYYPGRGRFWKVGATFTF